MCCSAQTGDTSQIMIGGNIINVDPVDTPDNVTSVSATAVVVAAAGDSDNMMGDTSEEDEGCKSIHDVLVEVDAKEFSDVLKMNYIDFKYGVFTIFAPSDRLLKVGSAALASAYNSETINDVVMFHIAANVMDGTILDDPLRKCGESLLMLSSDPAQGARQESSVTECDGNGNVFQFGPGNAVDDKPQIFGTAIETCNGVVYTIDGIMLPTLPLITADVDTDEDDIDVDVEKGTEEITATTVAPTTAFTREPASPSDDSNDAVTSTARPTSVMDDVVTGPTRLPSSQPISVPTPGDEEASDNSGLNNPKPPSVSVIGEGKPNDPSVEVASSSAPSSNYYYLQYWTTLMSITALIFISLLFSYV